MVFFISKIENIKFFLPLSKSCSHRASTTNSDQFRLLSGSLIASKLAWPNDCRRKGDWALTQQYHSCILLRKRSNSSLILTVYRYTHEIKKRLTFCAVIGMNDDSFDDNDLFVRRETTWPYETSPHFKIVVFCERYLIMMHTMSCSYDL